MVFHKGVLSPGSGGSSPQYTSSKSRRFFDEAASGEVVSMSKDHRAVSPLVSPRRRSGRTKEVTSSERREPVSGRRSRGGKTKKSSWNILSPSRSMSRSRSSNVQAREAPAPSPGTMVNPTERDMDESYIQKLITEGLWSDKPETIEEVLNKLSNLLFTSDEALKTARRDAMYRSGGHLAIVQAMKRNGPHKGIQTQGCRALANATWETSDFMHAITAVGGVTVICDAMRQFAKDEVVQICGSCALRNLTSLRKIATLVVEKDGLPAVLHAMKTFPKNPNIQECGCWTISHMCRDEKNANYMQRSQCFGAIGQAADFHVKETDVMMAARQASERLWALILRE